MVTKKVGAGSTFPDYKINRIDELLPWNAATP